MRITRTVIAIVALAVLTLLSGILHGRMTNRWGLSDSMSAAARNVEQLPANFGHWRGAGDEPLSDNVVKILECAGYMLRTYVNEATGEQVKAAVLTGPSGTMAVHTPELCYSSRNYTLDGQRTVVEIPRADGAADSFWTVIFRGNDVNAQSLRVYYAWSTGDRWAAAEDPRFSLAGSPAAYKIQVAAMVPPGSEAGEGDVCRRFLEDFLPEVRKRLTRPSD